MGRDAHTVYSCSLCSKYSPLLGNIKCNPQQLNRRFSTHVYHRHPTVTLVEWTRSYRQYRHTIDRDLLTWWNDKEKEKEKCRANRKPKVMETIPLRSTLKREIRNFPRTNHITTSWTCNQRHCDHEVDASHPRYEANIKRHIGTNHHTSPAMDCYYHTKEGKIWRYSGMCQRFTNWHPHNTQEQDYLNHSAPVENYEAVVLHFNLWMPATTHAPFAVEKKRRLHKNSW